VRIPTPVASSRRPQPRSVAALSSSSRTPIRRATCSGAASSASPKPTLNQPRPRANASPSPRPTARTCRSAPSPRRCRLAPALRAIRNVSSLASRIVISASSSWVGRRNPPQPARLAQPSVHTGTLTRGRIPGLAQRPRPQVQTARALPAMLAAKSRVRAPCATSRSERVAISGPTLRPALLSTDAG
jgi:hypothetical protein